MNKTNAINFLRNFTVCGLTGWCWECFWTGLSSAHGKDKSMTCKTSLWMFPIYGMAALLKPIRKILGSCSTFIRGTVYTALIFAAEYFSGCFLKRHKACPWDYSKAKLNFKGVIRLDYAPAWFLLSLLFEKILKKLG